MKECKESHTENKLETTIGNIWFYRLLRSIMYASYSQNTVYCYGTVIKPLILNSLVNLLFNKHTLLFDSWASGIKVLQSTQNREPQINLHTAIITIYKYNMNAFIS